MLRMISALALATATITAPAFAQNTKPSAQVNAPVAPVGNLSSNGLAAAGIAGGVAVAGIVVIAILAGNNDGTSTTSTPSTTPSS